jgi:hypothetical protein
MVLHLLPGSATNIFPLSTGKPSYPIPHSQAPAGNTARSEQKVGLPGRDQDA